MITRLTSEQKQKIKEYYDRYLQYGLSTVPSNKPVAEKAIKKMYKLMDEEEPEIYWVKSLTELVDLDSFLYSSFHSSLYSSLCSSLHSFLYSSFHSSLYSSLCSSLHSSLYSSLHSSLYSSLCSSLGSSLDSSLCSSLVWGQYNSSWISFFKYCDEILGIKYSQKDQEKLNLWVDMLEVCYFFVFKKFVILIEHPKEIHLDSNSKNHNLDDFAIKFQDNTGIYVVHGNVEKDLNCDRLMKENKITTLEYLEIKSKEKELAIKGNNND